MRTSEQAAREMAMKDMRRRLYAKTRVLRLTFSQYQVDRQLMHALNKRMYQAFQNEVLEEAASRETSSDKTLPCCNSFRACSCTYTSYRNSGYCAATFDAPTLVEYESVKPPPQFTFTYDHRIFHADNMADDSMRTSGMRDRKTRCWSKCSACRAKKVKVSVSFPFVMRR